MSSIFSQTFSSSLRSWIPPQWILSHFPHLFAKSQRKFDQFPLPSFFSVKTPNRTRNFSFNQKINSISLRNFSIETHELEFAFVVTRFYLEMTKSKKTQLICQIIGKEKKLINWLWVSCGEIEAHFLETRPSRVDTKTDTEWHKKKKKQKFEISLTLRETEKQAWLLMEIFTFIHLRREKMKNVLQ